MTSNSTTSVFCISFCTNKGKSGGVVVKLLACGARGTWLDSRYHRYNFTVYLLLPGGDKAIISLKRRYSLKNNQPIVRTK